MNHQELQQRMPDRLSILPLELIYAILDRLEPRDVILAAAISRLIRIYAKQHPRFYFLCRLDMNLTERVSSLGPLQLFSTRINFLVKQNAPIGISLKIIRTNNGVLWELDDMHALWMMRWRMALGSLKIAMRHPARTVFLDIQVPVNVWTGDIDSLLRLPNIYLRTLNVTGSRRDTTIFGAADMTLVPAVVPVIHVNIFAGNAPRLQTVVLDGINVPEGPIPAFSRAAVLILDEPT
jgi:hypothetical protein